MVFQGGRGVSWFLFFSSTAILLRNVFSTMWRRIAEFLMGGGGASKAPMVFVLVIKIPLSYVIPLS